MKKEPIEIASVSAENLLPALDIVRGCWKATTILWLQAMRLPVLSGVIIPEWSAQAVALVRRFCRQNRFSELLLRIDKPGERWTRRRGGYIVPLSKVRESVNELSREGMITILLEPASPYSNYCALGAVTLPDEEKMAIEVVGPGFDASDILRSDLQPHERYEVPLAPHGYHLNLSEARRFRRTYLVNSTVYQKSLEQRLAKIGARLDNPAFPDAALHSPKAGRRELIRRATKFLDESHQDLLLKHQTTYTPLSKTYLLRFVSRVGYLLDCLASYGIHLGATSISASLVSDRRLVFWDFFPARKQDTTALIPKER